MEMKTIKLTSESLQRVIALYDLPDVIIQVCGKDFFINQSILRFISPNLNEYFSKFGDPFIISINDDDQSNSLFETVTSESLIESCSIFVSLIQTGNLFVDSTIHLPSLILFSRKIFCRDFLSSIVQFSSSSDQSTSSYLSFMLSNFLFSCFSNCEENDEFSFKVCSKVYKCSSVAAAILSKKAFNIQKNDNQFCLEIECPEHINQLTFENEFENVFKFLFGFPLSLTNENCESLLLISSQLENSTIFNYCVEFLENLDLKNIETNLIILQHSELLSKKFDLSQFFSKISEDFENFSFECLSKIPPSGISKILQSKNLKLKTEDSLFEFLITYSKEWKSSSIPLFANVYFEYLSEENLSKFSSQLWNFNFQFPPSVIESLSFVFKNEKRFVHKNRHCCQTILNSIPSLSEFRLLFQNLTNKHSILKAEKSKIETEFLKTKESLTEKIGELNDQISSLNSLNIAHENEKQLFKKLKEKNNFDHQALNSINFESKHDT
jgi:hypothetical protein